MKTAPGMIFFLWHQDLAAMAAFFQHSALALLISRSPEAAKYNGVLRGWGYHLVPGSSSDGGALALRQLANILARGTSIAVMADGPRGPALECKPGIFWLAEMVPAMLIPVSASYSLFFRFPTWDRQKIPLPFGRWVVRLGDALPPPRPENSPLPDRRNITASGALDAGEEWCRSVVRSKRQDLQSLPPGLIFLAGKSYHEFIKEKKHG
jgi:lysophospholipid acyltransferase (LPLAT)-like uncharacterized protein